MSQYFKTLQKIQMIIKMNKKLHLIYTNIYIYIYIYIYILFKLKYTIISKFQNIYYTSID